MGIIKWISGVIKSLRSSSRKNLYMLINLSVGDEFEYQGKRWRLVNWKGDFGNCTCLDNDDSIAGSSHLIAFFVRVKAL